MAFLLTSPIWFYSEGFELLSAYARDGKLVLLEQKGKHGEEPLSGFGLMAEFVFNGTVHFGQNIIAFVLLSLVSPVTYSVASLVKRIFVIVMAIVWFGNKTTSIQAAGIALTYCSFLRLFVSLLSRFTNPLAASSASTSMTAQVTLLGKSATFD